MGNTYKYQDTYKICEKCNSVGIINQDLCILRTEAEKYYDENGVYQHTIYTVYLACSKGHLSRYRCGTIHHFEYCIEYIYIVSNHPIIVNENNVGIRKMDDLKKEIADLKNELVQLKNNKPSAPPIAEAELINDM